MKGAHCQTSTFFRRWQSVIATLGVLVPLAEATPATQLASPQPAFTRAAAGTSLTIIASTNDFIEGTTTVIDLTARPLSASYSHTWRQISGPRFPLTDLGSGHAQVDVTALEVATDAVLAFEREVTHAGQTESGQVEIRVRPADMTPILGSHAQIGGATTAVATFEHAGSDWALFNVGARLTATRATAGPASNHSLQFDGFIHELLVVEYGGQRFALAASGQK
ncbi:MAG: hypothetical protein ACJAQ3_003201, partial [Planctomycetota bacterium]